ncbi:MAG: SBBP repeat-containing protein, partial [Bryobacteraceae bacterium]
MIGRLAVLACLVSGGLQAAALPMFFEPLGGNYVANSHGQNIAISQRSVRIAAVGAAVPMTLEWRGAGRGVLGGMESTGGVSHYFKGSDQAQWRTGIPHYSQVQVHGLYRHVDVSYHFQDQRLEFDIHMRPGSDSGAPRFELPGARRLVLEAGGGLAMEIDGRKYRLRVPLAYQERNGKREQVQCRYTLNARHIVGFRLGAYDRSRELIVDPVIEFLTYLGGSGADQIQVIAPDPAGNVVVAGITSSADFPGGGAPAGSVSIFVTKLDSTGSSVLFTAILGSTQTSVDFFADSVSSLAVDSDGSIYVAGVTRSSNFPTTSGAWQQNSAGGFLTRLDSGGKIIYSTFLGPRIWFLNPLRVRARNGTAYVAGNLSAAEFLGTSGAYQRGLAGNLDFFVLGMAVDGSGPLFATAFGGSGEESLKDMTLDAAGNIVLVGTSTSPDLPLTADALPYGPPTDNSRGAVLVRLDATGSYLVSSTWIGALAAAAVAGLPDGSVVVAGTSVLPADLIGGAPHYTIDVAGPATHNYIAKFSAVSNRPAWTTDLVSGDGFYGGISTDEQGNIYWPGYPGAASGGALAFYNGGGISKLSADGSRLLYASASPGVSPLLTASGGAGGALYFGGYTSFVLPTTPGVLQPSPTGASQNPLDRYHYDGFVGVLDLSSFTEGNFFVIPPQFGIGLIWRIGEPAPKAVTQTIQF